MTDAATDRDHHGFWTRVRRALVGGAEATAHERVPQPHGGFDAALAEGWRAAAEFDAPLTLILVEIDNLPSYFAVYGADAAEGCFAAVEAALAGVLAAPGQVCVPMAAGRFGVVLPEVPLPQARRLAASMAQAVRSLALPHRASHAGAVTVGMGLALCLPTGEDDGALLPAATAALGRAQRRGLGRIEVADLRPRHERYAA